MMNNKKIFSFKLFLQTLISLKAPVLISLVIGVSAVIIKCVNIVSRVKESIRYGELSYYEGGVSSISEKEIFSVLSVNNFLLIILFVFVPIVGFMTWSFLNSRKNSDFYHSLPYSRTALFLSKYAALIASVFLMLLTIMLSEIIGVLIISDYVIVSIPSIIKCFLMYFVAALVMIAGGSLGCAFTGTFISSMGAGVIILFLPRLVFNATASFVNGIAYVVPFLTTGTVLDNNANLLWGIFTSVFDVEVCSEMISSVGGYVYSVALFAVYSMIAAIVFNKRKSETAGKAAGGKIETNVIRIIIVAVISAFAVALVMIDIVEKSGDVTTYAYAGIIIVFAIVALVIYEAIVSKSFSKVYRCFPSALIGIVLAVLWGVMTYTIAENALKFCPSADEIKYVTISPESYSGSNEDYFISSMSKVRIADEKVKKIVHDSLLTDTNYIRERDYEGYFRSYKDAEKYIVKIATDKTVKTREIFIDNSSYAYIKNTAFSKEDFDNIVKELPDSSKAKVTVTSDLLLQEDSDRIYDVFRNELIKRGFAGWLEMEDAKKMVDFHILAKFEKDGKKYNNSFRITNDYKETTSIYSELVNLRAKEKYGKEIDELIAVIKNASLGDISSIDMNTTIDIEYNNSANNDFYYMTLGEFVPAKGQEIDGLKKLADNISLTKSKTGGIDFSKPYVKINFNHYSTGKNDKSVSYELYVQTEDISSNKELRYN